MKKRLPFRLRSRGVHVVSGPQLSAAQSGDGALAGFLKGEESRLTLVGLAEKKVLNEVFLGLVLGFRVFKVFGGFGV